MGIQWRVQPATSRMAAKHHNHSIDYELNVYSSSIIRDAVVYNALNISEQNLIIDILLLYLECETLIIIEQK